MVRWLYILSICAIVAACGVFGLWLSERNQDDPELDEIRSRPGAVDELGLAKHDSQGPNRKASPLIVQAETLALYLNPSKSADRSLAPVLTVARQESSTPGPAAPSAKFRLHGTSYYPNQPGRSMALIGELGAAEGSERWVKEGAPLGHFVIHEIRRGAIVYRDGVYGTLP